MAGGGGAGGGRGAPDPICIKRKKNIYIYVYIYIYMSFMYCILHNQEPLSIKKRLEKEIYNWRQLSQAAVEQGGKPFLSAGASSMARTGSERLQDWSLGW